MPTLQHIAEYLALRTIASVANHLPYRGALAFGWIHAWLMFNVFRYRRRLALSRIATMLGPGLSARERRGIAWRSWRNIAFNGIEMMRIPRLNRAWAEQVCECGEFLDTLRAHKAATGKGFILACPHMGSWEMGLIFSHLHGLPIFTIGARQKNPLVTAYIEKLRQAPGIDVLERGSGTMRKVIQKLRQGSCLGILPDVRQPGDGIPTPFLGGQANIGKGMALFAIHTGVPIFVALVTRHGWARHRIAIKGPVSPDPDAEKDADARRITAEVMAVIDAAIRQDPGQWFWYNKRWILDPLEPRTGRGVDTPRP